MIGHSVTWTISRYGPRAVFACDEPADAPCKHGGECHALLFLADEMPEETYVGPEREITSGQVDLEWHGDHYTWRYAAEASMTEMLAEARQGWRDADERCLSAGDAGAIAERARIVAWLQTLGLEDGPKVWSDGLDYDQDELIEWIMDVLERTAHLEPDGG